MPTDNQILRRLAENFRHREHEPLRALVDAYYLERVGHPGRLTNYTIDLKPRLRPGGRLSPSAMCGCERQAVLQFTGVRGHRKVDPDNAAVLDAGEWMHHKWQARFLEMEAVLGQDRMRVVSTEGYVEIPELYIAGWLDNVLRMFGRKRVIDIKSINRNGFHRVTENDEPMAAHVRQLITYLKARRLGRGALLYECKDDQQLQIFSVRFEQVLWQQVEDWASSVLRWLDRRKLPPRHGECVRGNFMYSKCAFARYCWGGTTDAQLRRIAYREFPGVEQMWDQNRTPVPAEDDQ